MQARHHMIIGAVAASALIPVLGTNSLFFLAGSVLIDGDHYVDYVYRNRFRNFSIRKMFQYYRLLKEKMTLGWVPISLAHTFEALTLLLISCVIFNWLWLWAVFWGALFHFATDNIYFSVRNIKSRRVVSIIEYIIRRKRMEKRGIQPNRIYVAVFDELNISNRKKWE